MPGAVGGNVYARAWDALRRNPVVILPSVLCGLEWLAESRLFPLIAGSGQRAVAYLRDVLDFTVVTIGTCYSGGMAAAAWESGRSHVSDGTRALRQRGRDIAFLIALLFAPGWLVAALPHELQRSGPVALTFLMTVLIVFVGTNWCLCSIVVGNRRFLDALRESLLLTVRRFGKTIVLFVLAAGVQLVVYSAGRGPIVKAIAVVFAMYGILAYISIVYVGEYLRPARARNISPVPEIGECEVQRV